MGKSEKLRGFVLHFYFDVSNLFNNNVVTEFGWTLGPRYREIQDILPPRVTRIGGALGFLGMVARG